LLVVGLDRHGVHFDILVVQSPGGFHVELHFYLSLIVSDWKAQSFDIVPDRKGEIDPSILPALVRQQIGG
jgi:hypothetical protein